jgi:hypothetical protein
MGNPYLDLDDDARGLLLRAQQLDGNDVPLYSLLNSLKHTSIRLAMIMLEWDISQPSLDPDDFRGLAEELKQSGFTQWTAETIPEVRAERVAWQKEAHCLLSRLVGEEMKYELGEEIKESRSWW